MSATVAPTNARPETRSRWSDWFGLLGGALAWLVHLLAAYLVAEWGCLSGLQGRRFFDVSVLSAALAAVSLLLVLVSLAALVVAHRNSTRPLAERAATDARNVLTFTATTGVLSNAVFTFVIIVQSLPIMYFLREC